MLPTDFFDGYLEMYKKPKIKKTPWQKMVYAIKKPLHDNITSPMKWKLINLTCLVKGHNFKLMFKPDFRKNRKPWFHFWCDRCLVGVDITFKNSPPSQNDTTQAQKEAS
jgi:hypothetical protein